jgi:hypothetical protein
VSRARAALLRLAIAAATPAGRLAGRLLRGWAGLAAFGCAVAGVWTLAGLGWALLAAVPFLLLADHRTP